MRKFIRAYGMDRSLNPVEIVEVEVINDNYSAAYTLARAMLRKLDRLILDYEEVTRE